MAVRINKDDFEEKVLKSNLPVIVDFYSDSCIACKKLAPALGDIEDDYEGKFFVKNAEVLDRKIGAHTLVDLKTWVEALL